MDRAAKAASQWASEKPHWDTGPMVLFGRLIEAGVILTRDKLGPVYARFGIQRGEFDVLATLRRAGKPYALTPTELYETSMVTSGSMTHRIDRLEASGLVERLPNPADRRGFLVQLTAKGRTLIEAALVDQMAVQKEALGTLSEDEQITLSYLLGKLIAANCDPL